MAIVGPWAIAVYGEDIDWGVVPCRPPRPPAEEIQTFSDEKSIGMFTACENQATAWDVLKFATSEEQDGALLEATGQMPMRTGPARHLRRLLRGQPRLRGLRRAGRPHHRGAQRGQLDRGLADLPRRLVGVGDLRRQRSAGGADRGRRDDQRPRRRVMTTARWPCHRAATAGAGSPSPGADRARSRRTARRIPVRVAVGCSSSGSSPTRSGSPSGCRSTTTSSPRRARRRPARSSGSTTTPMRSPTRTSASRSGTSSSSSSSTCRSRWSWRSAWPWR